MPKPTVQINARNVLEDLRNGIDDEGLMVKYNLSYRQLQRLFRKLILAEYISPMELAERLCVTKSQVMEAFVDMQRAMDELDKE
jgi:hypothetical protein